MKFTLRKAKRSDLEGIADCFNAGLKSNFNIYTGRNEEISSDRLGKILRIFLSGKNRKSVLVVALDRKKVVGYARFFSRDMGRIRHIGECAWVVHPDYANNGVATLMLDFLMKQAEKNKIKRLEAEIAVENTPSVRLAKKFGFELEGRRKSALLLDDGRYVDVYSFGKVLD